mmetsp:Transcript_17283/g.43093  ORF Transcript_17283/g.43093 Transcript_17283/m.43093 type:complete len:209 (-) Transcript_17283:76-702(-)
MQAWRNCVMLCGAHILDFSQIEVETHRRDANIDIYTYICLLSTVLSYLIVHHLGVVIAKFRYELQNGVYLSFFCRTSTCFAMLLRNISQDGARERYDSTIGVFKNGGTAKLVELFLLFDVSKGEGYIFKFNTGIGKDEPGSLDASANLKVVDLYAHRVCFSSSLFAIDYLTLQLFPLSLHQLFTYTISVWLFTTGYTKLKQKRRERCK